MPAASVSILIPCYNEEATIAQVVAAAKTSDVGGLAREVVVVDDGSRDASWKVIEGIEGVRALRHERNRGKGAALKTALGAATGDLVLIQDGDLEYDPRDHRSVLAPLVEGRADFVLGSRFLYERPTFFFGERRSPFFTHYIGNLTIIALTNLLYGLILTDYEGAYKAFRRESLAGMKIEADGFEFDNEVVCRLLRRGCRPAEVPITYAPRSYEEGKKINWRDGVRMCWTIVKWRFKAA